MVYFNAFHVMSFLLRLPDYVFINILTEWWPAKSILKLDSAFCNYKERVRLWSLFTHPCFAVSEVDDKSKVLLWLCGKKMKMRTLSVFCGNLDMSIDTSKVTKLNFDGRWSINTNEIHFHVFQKLFNSCPMLVKLSFTSTSDLSVWKNTSVNVLDNVRPPKCTEALQVCCTSVALELNPHILSNLLEVSLNCKPSMLKYFMEQLRLQCTQLNVLKLTDVTCNITAELCSLISTNKQLQILTVTRADKLTNINDIMSVLGDGTYNHIQNINCVVDVQNISFSGLFSLLIRCQHTLQSVIIEKHAPFQAAIFPIILHYNANGVQMSRKTLTTGANTMGKYLHLRSHVEGLNINSELICLFTNIVDFGDVMINRFAPLCASVVETLAAHSNKSLIAFDADSFEEEFISGGAIQALNFYCPNLVHNL